ncbi:thiamine pyrophosphate-dependent enzyme [Leifsonia sp. 21MFCrub1.1]|uniref:thiamine pyrophosphate-dependent enzyme n=1 Tax=Leifsonia sp. 21MFCrub1.1 TaxID=1798223 RepID=UPI0008927F91|nr:thiamine pyrophosphate-dependent enzyme [Leifsonia sp. 21MFCrub1.1]SEB02199.1 pyruvate dehydrogenase E1 component alpha subunit [Leifsonia sp. 21MFCrub1.1]
MTMTTTERAAAARPDDAALLRRLYRTMATVRRLDLDGVAMQRQGIIPGYAPMRGQEAAQVGSAAALDLTRDFAFPTYRELGVAVAMGVDPVAYLASHQGAWHGGLWDAAAARLAPINAVVGGAVTHAVGWALGAKLDRTGGVAIAYFGDGASSQGDIHEAMNTAGVSQLPVVFFCQNNGWAISVPTEQQVAGGSVAARGAGYGMPGVRVDGNDVLAVYDATAEALERARTGGGPTVIEAMTYRMGPHSTSDDPGRYRTLDEEQSWLARDPLALCEQQLRQTGTIGDEFFAEVADTAGALADRVRDDVAALGGRPAEEMFDFVFSDPPAALLGQRRAWEESRLG